MMKVVKKVTVSNYNLVVLNFQYRVDAHEKCRSLSQPAFPAEVATGISLGDRKPAFLTSSQWTNPDVSTELRTEITTPVFQNHRIKGSLIVSDQSQEFGSVIIS